MENTGQGYSMWTDGPVETRCPLSHAASGKIFTDRIAQKLGRASDVMYF